MKTLPQAGCRTALVEAALEVCLGARLYLVNGSNGGLNCTLCVFYLGLRCCWSVKLSPLVQLSRWHQHQSRFQSP